MDTHVISTIPGIEYFPVISLAIFFGVFAIVIVWYFKADRTKLAKLAESALADAMPSQQTGIR